MLVGVMILSNLFLLKKDMQKMYVTEGKVPCLDGYAKNVCN